MTPRPDNCRITHGTVRGEAFSFFMDGVPVAAYPGESLAAALLAAGRRHGRVTERRNQPRGYFCGMGVCWECIVVVDGRPGVRACMTPARAGMNVRTQHGRPAPAAGEQDA